jgi:hypothetical protein
MVKYKPTNNLKHHLLSSRVRAFRRVITAEIQMWSRNFRHLLPRCFV